MLQHYYSIDRFRSSAEQHEQHEQQDDDSKPELFLGYTKKPKEIGGRGWGFFSLSTIYAALDLDER